MQKVASPHNVVAAVLAVSVAAATLVTGCPQSEPEGPGTHNPPQAIAQTTAKAAVHQTESSAQALTIFTFTPSFIAVAFSPDGSHLLAGASPRTKLPVSTLQWTSLRDGAPSGKLEGMPSGTREASRSGHRLEVKGHRVSDVSFGPDGKTVVASYALFGAPQGRVTDVWDAGSGKLRHSYEARLSIGYKSLFPVTQVRGKALVRVGEAVSSLEPVARSEIHLSNAVTGALIQSLPVAVSRKSAYTYDLSRDATTLAVTYYVQDTSGKDTSQIPTVTRSGVAVYDLTSGKTLLKLPVNADAMEAVALSPDHRLLATGRNQNSVQVWNITTGKPVAMMGSPSTADDCLAFSPDGKSLATAGWDSPLVHLWDVATGRLKHTLDDHSGGLTALAFAPDGKSLATANSNGSVRLWRVE